MKNGMMTIRDIAGFCPEEAVWKMMADVSGFLHKEKEGYLLSADTIMVDGEQFLVTGAKNTTTEEEMVWSLGALAYYVATGHDIFGGHGHSYQQEHPQVALPMLQKSFHALTPIIHRCLCANPSDRISMSELELLARKGLATCAQRQRQEIKETEDSAACRKDKRIPQSGSCGNEKWPEKMIEI